ncbi:unnamed protein product [marine sediment metagenome]|uniref:Uncharacterized protein n=1 Tax=marine sediment metagenome TaxID=412755 RepID=X0VU18_9ZZZZ
MEFMDYVQKNDKIMEKTVNLLSERELHVLYLRLGEMCGKW